MKNRMLISELQRSRSTFEKQQNHLHTSRRAKLQSFLDQHKRAEQWSTSVAALHDAVRHGVTPTDGMICEAMRQCGLSGKLRAAKELYTSLYQRIGKPRTLDAHVAFMQACGSAGDFTEATAHFKRLRDRDVVQFGKRADHRPVVNDDLTTEYLRAALAATMDDTAKQRPSVTTPSTSTSDASHGSPDASTKKTSEKSSSGTEVIRPTEPLPWEVALGELFALRAQTSPFRKHVALTPLLLESAVQLAEVGRQWELCLRIVRGAVQLQEVLPPEVYDSAIRACFHSSKHVHVVELMQEMIASKMPPDERSVRLAMVSAEEVSAMEKTSANETPSAWALSLVLFESLQQNGLPMYQQSYESPLRSSAMAGQWEAALGILSVMRRDRRPVSAALYRTALAARIESCSSFEQAERLLRLPVAGDSGSSVVVTYLAAMRCCMRLKDWRHFHRLDKEMKDRDIPETYDKIKLLMEAAFAQEKYHSVLMRFARLSNITTYERSRVEEAQGVRLFPEDFEVSDRLLDMVITSFHKTKDTSRDPMVEVAYRTAMKQKERGKSSMLSGASPTPSWMFSQEARDEREPSSFQ